MSEPVEVAASGAPQPWCGTELFSLPGWLATAWPDCFIRLHGAVQGPAPALCAREPHDDPWHWDGKATWFR